MNDRVRGYLFVGIQFVLLGLLFFWPATHPYGQLESLFAISGFLLGLLGSAILLIALIGLGRSLTALPNPKPDAVLVTTGLYRLARHPIYTGIILLGFGQLGLSGYWPQLLFYGALIVLFSFKARFEERMLMARYPDYAEYMKRVGRFFPRLR